MVTTPIKSCQAGFLMCVRGIALAVAALVVAGPAAAQPVEEKPRILFSYDLKTPPRDLGEIVLRPNVEQSVYLYVKNPSKFSDMRDVQVKLVQVLPDNSTQDIAKADPVPVLKKDKYERLKFGKPAAALAKDKPIPWPELEGPPFRFQILVSEAGSKEEPTPINVPVSIMQPDEYITPGAAKYNENDNSFSVTLTAADKFFGPEAVVELVLSREVIPGLVPKRTAGAFRQILTKKGDTVKLTAEDLQFVDDEPPPHGHIYVTVDGFQRAFIYNTSFSGEPDKLVEGSRARIVAPRYAVPGKKCLVRLEVDNAPLATTQVLFGFDRAGDKQFIPLQTLPGSRQQQVYFAPEGPKGGMVFKTIVQDWVKELDTTEVYGPRQVRVELAKRNLVNEQANEDERLPQFAGEVGSPYAPLSFSNNAVFATIMLDGTEPDGITFEWPQNHELVRGSELLLRARGRDKESGISKVDFFLGAAVDGKMPPKAILSPGVLVKAEEKGGVAFWQGELPIPTDKPGKFEVSVQFTNGAGLSATETVILKLVDPPKRAKAGAIIKGIVSEGELTPKDVGVGLVDDKGVVKASTKTNEKGQYKIEGVPPGTYRVVAVRTADQTQGQAAVTVVEGSDPDPVDLQLSR